MPRKKADKPEGPHFVDTHVGQRVFMRRKFLNISQAKLGSIIDVRPQQVQKYESGANRISVSMLWKIAECLKVKIGYFFEGLGQDEAAMGFSEPAPEPFTSAFLSTSEGIDMARHFPNIDHKQTRRDILALVRTLANEKSWQQ